MEKTYTLEPLGNYLFVDLIKEDEKITKGGIIMPGTATTKPQLAKVIAVGPGLNSLMTDRPMPMTIKVGDLVILNKYGCQEVELPNGDVFSFLGEGDIIARLKEDDTDSESDIG